MRVHRVVVLAAALAAAAACSFESVGDGSSPVLPDDAGLDTGTPPEPGPDGASAVPEGGDDAGDDAGKLPTGCGPETCAGCCNATQCEPGTEEGLCGKGGALCGPCDDGGPAPDASDGGELDSGHDAEPPDAGHDAGHDAEAPDAGHDAGPPDAGHDAAPPDAGKDAGTDLPFGAACTSSTECSPAFPDCETVTTDSGVKTVCTKPCGAVPDGGCPKPPTNGVCGSVGYCE